eukprot:ctg_2059.g557
MCEARRRHIVAPNKHSGDGEVPLFEDHVLEQETYIGGHVEALRSGVFRSDLPLRFVTCPATLDRLQRELDAVLRFAVEVECRAPLADVLNYDEVRAAIQQRLEALRRRPERDELPLLYHLDVGAMYPNIILTNRLQPHACVTRAQALGVARRVLSGVGRRSAQRAGVGVGDAAEPAFTRRRGRTRSGLRPVQAAAARLLHAGASQDVADGGADARGVDLPAREPFLCGHGAGVPRSPLPVQAAAEAVAARGAQVHPQLVLRLRDAASSALVFDGDGRRGDAHRRAHHPAGARAHRRHRRGAGAGHRRHLVRRPGFVPRPVHPAAARRPAAVVLVPVRVHQRRRGAPLYQPPVPRPGVRYAALFSALRVHPLLRDGRAVPGDDPAGQQGGGQEHQEALRVPGRTVPPFPRRRQHRGVLRRRRPDSQPVAGRVGEPRRIPDRRGTDRPARRAEHHEQTAGGLPARRSEEQCHHLRQAHRGAAWTADDRAGYSGAGVLVADADPPAADAEVVARAAVRAARSARLGLLSDATVQRGAEIDHPAGGLSGRAQPGAARRPPGVDGEAVARGGRCRSTGE